MVYPAVTPAELRQRQLEVTVWHHQSDGRHEFLGEFLLDLAGKQTQLVVSSPEKKRINRLVQVGILTLFTTSLVLYLTNKLQLHWWLAGLRQQFIKMYDSLRFDVNKALNLPGNSTKSFKSAYRN